MKQEQVLRQSLGIDVSKDSLSYCLGVLKTTMDKEFTQGEDVSNDQKGFKELEKWLKKMTDRNQPLLIVMEATGVYHEGVVHYLYELGYKVSIMQSGRVKRYGQSLDQRSKTDALDSKMLSMLGCERNLELWAPASKVFETLKYLGRERFRLVKNRSIEKNRLHAMKTSVYGYDQAIKRYKKRIRLLDQQIIEIESEMLEIVNNDRELREKVNYLTSIPGLSFISVVTVVAETSGFSLFTNGKQLVSYSGYDVVLRESGNYKGKTKISKKGNKYIRAVLHMPSMAVIRTNPTLKPFYQRLKPAKAKPLIALVAVQRKLLIMMFSLWKNNQYYDPEYEIKKAARKQVLAAQDSIKNEFVAS